MVHLNIVSVFQTKVSFFWKNRSWEERDSGSDLLSAVTPRDDPRRFRERNCKNNELLLFPTCKQPVVCLGAWLLQPKMWTSGQIKVSSDWTHHRWRDYYRLGFVLSVGTDCVQQSREDCDNCIAVDDRHNPNQSFRQQKLKLLFPRATLNEAFIYSGDHVPDVHLLLLKTKCSWGNGNCSGFLVYLYSSSHCPATSNPRLTAPSAPNIHDIYSLHKHGSRLVLDSPKCSLKIEWGNSL